MDRRQKCGKKADVGCRYHKIALEVLIMDGQQGDGRLWLGSLCRCDDLEIRVFLSVKPLQFSQTFLENLNPGRIPDHVTT